MFAYKARLRGGGCAIDVNSGAVLINWHFRGLGTRGEGALTFFQGPERGRGSNFSLTGQEKGGGNPVVLEFPDHYREYFCNLLIIWELRGFHPVRTLE
jgi:hypothetical protein